MNKIIDCVRKIPPPSTPVLASSNLCGSILPIAQIAIGAVYLNECPRQPYIPIYLIVGGVFGLFFAALVGLPCPKKSKDGTPNMLGRISPSCKILTSLFIVCWFFTGNVWIYSIYQPNYVKNSTNLESYCNKTLYLFAFLSTTLLYILVGLILVGLCCAVYCAVCCRCDKLFRVNDDV